MAHEGREGGRKEGRKVETREGVGEGYMYTRAHGDGRPPLSTYTLERVA